MECSFSRATWILHARSISCLTPMPFLWKHYLCGRVSLSTALKKNIFIKRYSFIKTCLYFLHPSFRIIHSLTYFITEIFKPMFTLFHTHWIIIQEQTLVSFDVSLIELVIIINIFFVGLPVYFIILGLIHWY